VTSKTEASDSRQPSNQSPDNQSSTAEINQQNIGTESPGNDVQLQTLAQFAQNVPYSQQPLFTGGQSQLQNGFNFGAQPGQFNFGFSPPGYIQNTNPQTADTPDQGTNAFQQNFPPFNFRTAAQLTNQFNVGQNENSLPNSAAQQNIGQYTSAFGSGLPQQVQGFGQLNGFQFPSPNIGQGFSQQFTSPNFAAGGFYNSVNQSSPFAPSEGDQRSVVGFYGGAPNIGGYSFNGAPLQEQQQNSFLSPGGFSGPSIEQYANGNSQLDSGASGIATQGDQAANAFSRFSFNPAAFQNGGVGQEASLSSRASDQNIPQTVRQPSQLPQQIR
jgi:hypothetical protein